MIPTDTDTALMVQRRAKRNYSCDAENTAFAKGYDDAWQLRDRGEAAYWAAACPNAYNAGYWEGVADRANIRPKPHKRLRIAK
jgi:hypothetical protein